MSKYNNAIHEVIFLKNDGTERMMLCTTMPEYIDPKAMDRINHTTGRPKMSEGLNTVWDVEKHDWRSFHTDSIIDERALNEAEVHLMGIMPYQQG